MIDYQYLTPQQIAGSSKYPFTIGQVRNALLFRHKNGLRNAVRKVGKRLVLRKDLWDAWIESQKEERGCKK